MAALGMGIRSEWVWCQSMVSPRVGAMQLCKLHKHASELEQSGGGRGRAEAERLGGGQRWVKKGKGGHTMTGMPVWYHFLIVSTLSFIYVCMISHTLSGIPS